MYAENLQLDLYQKHYFFEIDIKEKIAVRAQVIFGFIFAILTYLGYLLKVIDFAADVHIWASVLIILFFAFCSLVFASYYAVRAFWGNEFGYIPTLDDVSKYRQDLLSHRDEIGKYSRAFEGREIIVDVDLEFKRFIIDSYSQCCSKNMLINTRRARQLYYSFRFLIISGGFLSFASLIFFVFDMDSSSPRRVQQISDRAVERSIDDLSLVIVELRRDLIAINEGFEMSKRTGENKKDDSSKKIAPPKPPERPANRTGIEDFLQDDKKN